MRALRACDTLAALLETTQSLRVHSVFTHACNLRTGAGEMVTLQTCGMPLVPRGCILPCDNLQKLFEQNEQVAVLSPWHLGASACDIGLADTPVGSLRLQTHVAIADLAGLAQALQSFLPRNPPAGGFHAMTHAHDRAAHSPAQTGLAAALVSLTHWLCKENNESTLLGKALERMVGLGAGLTPAADDFLLGVLLLTDVLLEPRREELVAALRPLLPGTTEISAAMLANGCAGRYPEPLLALFSSAPEKLAGALANAADYGHSSGHDALCGVAFALNVLGKAIPGSALPVQNREQPTCRQAI